MNSDLTALREQRQKLLDGLDANRGEINLDIFEDFYPDRAHFLFELLQNAEDVGATHARFALSRDECRFIHNGRPFSIEDIKSITGLHNTRNGLDQDFSIPHLDRLLRAPSLEGARLLWRTLQQLKPDHMTARYRKNGSSHEHTEPSQLVHQLKGAAWVPQGEGRFVRPAAADHSLLPEGFPYDAGWKWLDAIEFEADAKRRSMQEYLNRHQIESRLKHARELGFQDIHALERGQQFSALPPEFQKKVLSEYAQRRGFKLPENSPSNPDRRAQKIGAQAQQAPDKHFEHRSRSVAIGKGESKEEAGSYLRHQYTNTDGIMCCQVCQDALPFQLENGNYYFEMAEFLPGLEGWHSRNYLALCPNHAAMFLHANGSKDTLRSSFPELTGDRLEIVLAGEPATIYFTETHRLDLRTMLKRARERG